MFVFTFGISSVCVYFKDIFHLCFCGEAAKKTSIDGLKW